MLEISRFARADPFEFRYVEERATNADSYIFESVAARLDSVNTFFFLLFFRLPANLPDSVINALPNDLNNGIYYGWSALRGRVYKMVLSIGWNPYYKNLKRSMVKRKRGESS